MKEFLRCHCDYFGDTATVRGRRSQLALQVLQTPLRLTGTPLVVDHLLPLSLGGSDNRSNLATSCNPRNKFKTVKTAAIDPGTGQLVPLFNPRTQVWRDHFAWVNGGPHVIGITPTGRTTVIALRLNNENVVEARSLWVEFGWHPPIDEP